MLHWLEKNNGLLSSFYIQLNGSIINNRKKFTLRELVQIALFYDFILFCKCLIRVQKSESDIIFDHIRLSRSGNVFSIKKMPFINLINWNNWHYYYYTSLPLHCLNKNKWRSRFIAGYFDQDYIRSIFKSRTFV